MNNTVLELKNISYKYKNDLILNKINLISLMLENAY